MEVRSLHFFYIFELSFFLFSFLLCDAKDMFNALMMFFVLEDK